MAKQPALAAKPFWITEVGWQCLQTTGQFAEVCPESSKAQALTETMNGLHQQAGITQPIIWYNLHDHPATTTYGGFGLEVKPIVSPYTGTPLPAWTAYQNL